MLESALYEEITQTGTIKRTWNSTGKTENVTVSFTTTFSKTPTVTVTPHSNSTGCTASIVSVSLSSFIVAISYGSKTGDLTWNWTAVGLVAK